MAIGSNKIYRPLLSRQGKSVLIVSSLQLSNGAVVYEWTWLRADNLREAHKLLLANLSLLWGESGEH